MVSEALFSRIQQICEACGYDTPAALARAAGVAGQNAGNWKSRGTIGKEAAIKVCKVTGASLDWLLTGSGQPFPDGPIRAATSAAAPGEAARRLSEAEANIDAIGGVLASLISSLGRLAPAEAARVAVEIRQALAKPGRAPEVLPELLRVAESAVPAPAGASSSRKRTR